MENCEVCGGRLKADFPAWNARYSQQKKITLKARCENCSKLHLCYMEFKNLDEYMNFQIAFDKNK